MGMVWLYHAKDEPLPHHGQHHRPDLQLVAPVCQILR